MAEQHFSREQVEEHQKAFNGLIKGFAWLFGVSALILIFLAFVGT